MYTTFLTVALFSATAVRGVLADFAVNQPELVQGQDAKISWQNTNAPPYNILIVPSDDPCEKVLVDLGDHQSTSMTWKNITVTPGQKVLISIEDNNGDEAWSQEITVKAPPASSSAASSSSSAHSSSLPASSSSVASSSASAVPSASSASASVGTAVEVPVSSTSSDAAPSSSSAIVGPVGAAGDGIISSSGSLAAAAVSIPALVLAALGAVLVL